MPGPPATSHEAERLAALQSLALLDTPPEERFDRITRLAAELLGAPVALVSLIDRDRQFMKSRQGLPLAVMPRAGAFCNETLASPGTFVVEDARSDPRFATMERATPIGELRAYAGHALCTAGGQPVATLCVLDIVPRQWNEAQREQLAQLARMAELEVLKTELEQVRARAHATELRLRRFYSLSLDMLCTADFSGMFTSLSPAWEVALGWSREELMSRPFLEFVHPADRAATAAETQLLVKGGITVSFENRYRCLNGTYRHLLWTATGDVEHACIHAAARDISALRGTEDELRRSRTAAEAANDARGRFLADLGNGLRVPLNSMLGLSSVLLEEATGLSERHRAFLQQIQGSGRDLALLANDVMEFVALENTPVEPALESVDPVALVEAVVARARLDASVKGIEIREERPASVASLTTDARLLRQVLGRLIGTAVRHTVTGHVTVRLSVDPASGAAWSVAIEDQAGEFAYEFQDGMIVVRSQGAGEDSPRHAGAGLGLTLARSLCERLGYRLNLTTRPGAGTTFVVVLDSPGPGSGAD